MLSLYISFSFGLFYKSLHKNLFKANQWNCLKANTKPSWLFSSSGLDARFPNPLLIPNSIWSRWQIQMHYVSTAVQLLTTSQRMAILRKSTSSSKAEDGALESIQCHKLLNHATKGVKAISEVPKAIPKPYLLAMESYQSMSKITSRAGPECSSDTVLELDIKAPKRAPSHTREPICFSEAIMSQYHS